MYSTLSVQHCTLMRTVCTKWRRSSAIWLLTMLNFYTVHQIILVIWLKLTYQALTAFTFTLIITND